MTATDYPRDLIGYGPNPPYANWPNGARLVLEFVLAYESGAETNILHGDGSSENELTKIHGYRWIDYQHIDESMEREHMRLGIETITEVTGERPLGWVTGRPA